MPFDLGSFLLLLCYRTYHFLIYFVRASLPCWTLVKESFSLKCKRLQKFCSRILTNCAVDYNKNYLMLSAQSTVNKLYKKSISRCKRVGFHPGPREKIFQGVQRSIPGLQILLAPPNLIGTHAVKSFFVGWVYIFI